MQVGAQQLDGGLALELAHLGRDDQNILDDLQLDLRISGPASAFSPPVVGMTAVSSALMGSGPTTGPRVQPFGNLLLDLRPAFALGRGGQRGRRRGRSGCGRRRGSPLPCSGAIARSAWCRWCCPGPSEGPALATLDGRMELANHGGPEPQLAIRLRPMRKACRRPKGAALRSPDLNDQPETRLGLDRGPRAGRWFEDCRGPASR